MGVKEGLTKFFGGIAAGPIGVKLASVLNNIKEKVKSKPEITTSAAMAAAAAAGAAAARKQTRPQTYTPQKEVDLKKIIYTSITILATLFFILASQWLKLSTILTTFLVLILLILFTIFYLMPELGKKIGGWTIILLAVFAGYFIIQKMGVPPEIGGALSVIALLIIGLYKLKPEWGEPVVKAIGIFALFFSGIFAFAILPVKLPAIFLTIYMTFFIFAVIAAKGFKKGIIPAGILILLILYTSYTYPAFVNKGSPAYTAFEEQRTSLAQLVNFLTRGVTEGIPLIAEKAGTELKRQMLIMSGNYETGVEEASGKRLGVFLDNMMVSPSKVPEDGTITAVVNFRAESFEKGLDVKIQCKAGEVFGTVKPRSEFNIQAYEPIQQLTCSIPASSIGRATLLPVKFIATFDFVTGAYQKAYFMEQDTIRTYTSREQNPLAALGITDLNPSTVYSSGPMKIGMSVTHPISIIPKEKYGPALTITLEKQWTQGKLLKVKEMEITVPPGLTIDAIQSIRPKQERCKQEKAEGSQDTQEELTCKLDEQFMNLLYPEGTNVESIIVNTELDSADRVMSAILADGTEEKTPLSIRNFKVKIKYEFQIEQQGKVTITEARNLQTGGADGIIKEEDILPPPGQIN